MRPLIVAIALALTPAAFAQAEPAWKTWLRQGEQAGSQIGRSALREGTKLRKRAEAEWRRIDPMEKWNFLQEMWKIRGSLFLDPETILSACGVDSAVLRWLRAHSSLGG